MTVASIERSRIIDDYQRIRREAAARALDEDLIPLCENCETVDLATVGFTLDRHVARHRYGVQYITLETVFNEVARRRESAADSGEELSDGMKRMIDLYGKWLIRNYHT